MMISTSGRPRSDAGPTPGGFTGTISFAAQQQGRRSAESASAEQFGHAVSGIRQLQDADRSPTVRSLFEYSAMADLRAAAASLVGKTPDFIRASPSVLSSCFKMYPLARHFEADRCFGADHGFVAHESGRIMPMLLLLVNGTITANRT